MTIIALLAVVVMMVEPLVLAPFRLAGQPTVQVRLDHYFDPLIGKPGHDVDAVLGKDGQSALADAADDDQFDAQLCSQRGNTPGWCSGVGSVSVRRIALVLEST